MPAFVEELRQHDVTPHVAQHRGLPKVDWNFTFALNLVRIRSLTASTI